jgi:hypothetical protein
MAQQRQHSMMCDKPFGGKSSLLCDACFVDKFGITELEAIEVLSIMDIIEDDEDYDEQ